MICHRCLLRQSRQALSRRSTLFEATQSSKSFPSRPIPRRHATTTAKPLSPNVATQTTPRQGDGTSHNPPAATSTSAAQPFSAPHTPSPKGEGAITGKASGAGKEAKPKPSVTVKSSCPAGTPLKGLNFIKGQQDPLALEDSAYPPWLWTVLDKKKSDDVEENREGLFCKSSTSIRDVMVRKRECMLTALRSEIRKTATYSSEAATQTGSDEPRHAGTEDTHLRTVDRFASW